MFDFSAKIPILPSIFQILSQTVKFSVKVVSVQDISSFRLQFSGFVQTFEFHTDLPNIWWSFDILAQILSFQAKFQLTCGIFHFSVYNPSLNQNFKFVFLILKLLPK